MAANYWTSTQFRHWFFTRDELASVRQQLEDEDRQLIQQYPLPNYRLLNAFFHHQLTKLGKRMSLRQQALATAQVYLKRFYTKVEIRRTNPYLVIATALYLACKVEECPQHIRLIISESRLLWPAMFVVADIAKVGECEFALISEMNSQMIVHHPYRTLRELQEPLKLGQEEVSVAWSVINDHYLTDLPLLYPPHVIAVAAIFMAVIGRKSQSTSAGSEANGAALASPASAGPLGSKDASVTINSATSQEEKAQHLITWLAKSDVDIEAVMDCSQEIISLYAIMEQFHEATCKEQITRFVRARGLDK